jgi:hypothetical protein
MNEPSETQRFDAPAEETIREHPQDPAEGADEDERDRDEPPRVHPQDPAEG